MIVKTVRLKKPVFQQLIEYVQSDKGRGGDQGFEIHHNLNPTCDLAEQFERNDQYRKRRSGGVVSYHEILSFHANDRLHLTTVILEDLARKYIELRGSNALCYAAPHLSELHPHIHFVFSGNHYRSAKTLRLGHAAFRRIRREIEAYQVERYPKLEHSIVYLKDRQRTKGASRKEKYPSDRAYQLSKARGLAREPSQSSVS